jgi:hypothetical protein
MTGIRPFPTGALLTVLKGTRAAGLGALLALGMACGHRKAKAPEWVLSAPAPTVLAVSGAMGWLVEQPHFQSQLERFPLAEQCLDLFLKRARISPHQETGRVTFFLLSGGGLKVQPSDFLIELGGFRDPGALTVAVADAFPPEGSLAVGGQEMPLYIILDFNQFHIRALVDRDGRVWLGEVRALARLGSGRLPPRGALLESAQWINGAAPFQGFLKLDAPLPGEWAKTLPQGVEALAWSVTPGAGPNASFCFELAMAGTPDGILKVAPWLQRFVAAATATRGAAPQAPEVLQERRRIGLRAQLTQEQVNLALSKLNQPGLTFGPRRP